MYTFGGLAWPWGLACFFFSFSRSKLITYAAPLFPPLAVLFGRALDLWADREDGRVRCRFPLALSAVMAAAILALPTVAHQPLEPGKWVPVCALPVVLILAWGVVPLFVRRLGAERVVCLSWLLLALFLTSLNRPAAEYLGGYRSVKDLSVVLNAAWTAYSLDREFRSGDDGAAPAVAFGIYDLASRTVWSPRAEPDAAAELPAGLMAAPAEGEAFADLARAVASGRAIARLLDRG